MNLTQKIKATEPTTRSNTGPNITCSHAYSLSMNHIEYTFHCSNLRPPKDASTTICATRASMNDLKRSIANMSPFIPA